MATRLKVSQPDTPVDVIAAVRQAIEAAIEGSTAEVTGGGGHFSIAVRAQAFGDKSKLERQRMVLRAIKHLMQGDGAPVHAVDQLTTEVP